MRAIPPGRRIKGEGPFQCEKARARRGVDDNSGFMGISGIQGVLCSNRQTKARNKMRC